MMQLMSDPNRFATVQAFTTNINAVLENGKKEFFYTEPKAPQIDSDTFLIQLNE